LNNKNFMVDIDKRFDFELRLIGYVKWGQFKHVQNMSMFVWHFSKQREKIWRLKPWLFH
jgi:hypothetical protein